MYNQTYEICAAINSVVIIVTSTYIFIITENYNTIFIILSGTMSYITRLYRIIHQEYVMNHPIVYLDIISAIIVFVTYIYDPYIECIYYYVLCAFGLMIIAAIMSWDIFSINLVQESFYLQFLGHIIISISLTIASITCIEKNDSIKLIEFNS